MNYLFLIIVLVIVLGVLGIAAFTNFNLDNEHYDRLKWITIRWSYLVVFIGLIAKTFDIPHGTETVTIVAGIGAMLAGLLGISNNNYIGEKVEKMFDEDALKEMFVIEEETEEEIEEDTEEEEESEE